MQREREGGIERERESGMRREGCRLKCLMEMLRLGKAIKIVLKERERDKYWRVQYTLG